MIEPGSLAAATVTFGAGAVLFLSLFGRTILQMRDSVLKRLVSYGSICGLTVVPGLMGLWLGWGGWVWVPGLILAGAAGLELRLILKRSHLRGDEAVESENVRRRWLRPVTTCELAMRRFELMCPALPIDKLRIVHISDIHYHDDIPFDWYVLALNHASFMDPDLFFITGDFVSDARYIERLPELLTHARSRFGVYGILGNHDHWVDSRGVEKAVSSAGVRLLGNRGERVRIGEGNHIRLAGAEQPWNLQESCLPSGEEPLLALTHTPDNVYVLARQNALAVFAGHSHGGQIVLPGVGALVIPSRYGRLFTEGHFRIGLTHLFVNTGLGTSAPPLRVYCPPEILVVDILKGGGPMANLIRDD